MSSIDLTWTAVSIQAPKPSTVYGTLAVMPVSSVSRMLLGGSVAQVPANAVVQSATLTLRQGNKASWPGARTVSIRHNTSRFTTSSAWDGRPSNAGTYERSVSKADSLFGASWQFDITAMVQAWVSGALDNFGIVVFSDSTTAGFFQGSTASWGKPTLSITYTVQAEVPSNLRPQGGAVSLAKPTLTADVGSGTSAIQVQVDPSANASTPAFDSGEVPATAGLYNLASPTPPSSGTTPTYAGLADGASTQHRWRAKNALGWSAWSPWASFSRVAWKALTITSPGASSEDPSPTGQATYAGTVSSWRFQFRNADGVVVSDSQWQSGSTISFTSTRSVGASGTAVAYVRDSVDRESTPGDPDYLVVTKSFGVAASGAPAPFTDVQALKASYASPVVRVVAQRSEIPDEVVVYRDDVLVGRVPGSQVMSGSALSFDDYTAPMNRPATYTLRAVRNGQFSDASTGSTIVPTCVGRWLIDPDTGDAVAIWDAESEDQAQPELAALSRPIGGDNAVVRRRLSRSPREGAGSGTLLQALGVDADAMEATLRRWCDPDDGYDAGHVFRYVLGNQNDPVIVGDLTFSEDPRSNAGQRVTGVSYSWWWQG